MSGIIQVSAVCVRMLGKYRIGVSECAGYDPRAIRMTLCYMCPHTTTYVCPPATTGRTSVSGGDTLVRQGVACGDDPHAPQALLQRAAAVALLQPAVAAAGASRCCGS